MVTRKAYLLFSMNVYTNICIFIYVNIYEYMYMYEYMQMRFAIEYDKCNSRRCVHGSYIDRLNVNRGSLQFDILLLFLFSMTLISEC